GEANRRTLLLRERSLEEAQRLAGVGHFERDIVTDEVTWAENMFAIHGVVPETFFPSRESFLQLVFEESRAVASERVQLLGFPPTSGHLECKILRPDDETVRDMIYDWEIIHDHDGKPIKDFGVAQDVTDLKLSEGKARENEARLRDITECMSDFIWETDQDGVIAYFDSGSSELTLDVEIGATKDENIDVSEGEGDRAFMAQAIARQESFRNLTFALRNKENEVRWVRVSANPRFNQDGRFIGFRGAGADITEQRRQRIVESERSKGDALDRLAGGIAHEINNLLQPVVVYSSMGETETPEVERTQGYFRKIFTASQQAVSIVQDILTFAREGRAKPEPVCLATAIAEGLDIIRPTLPSTIHLTELGGGVKLDVAANVGGLHQVLFNLMRNAVDAAGPNGKVSIDAGSVVLYPRDADRWAILPGRFGYFSVTDDGPGVDEQNLSRVFDPFFTTKPRGVGTGLGLSVVAGMVREWGGAVDVRSQPGQTVFTAYMPLVHTERQAAE
ncbi:MAG: PAS domain S-box protein, partial [Rhodospirillaceae bacterium]|nr:PAS domain S-box protein [Rhodospirillaceae bacterium]